jgi:nitrous oxide reductase accessory protein NosL
MRIGIVAITVCATLALAGLAVAADKAEAPRCDNCGMFMEKSATQVHATFEVEGVKHEHKFVCLSCVYEYAASHYDGAVPTKLTVLDYNTFGTDKLAWLDTGKAWYLSGTSKLAGSMQPYIAAFASKDAALAQQQKLGGELLEFKAVQERLLKAQADDGGAAKQASAGDAEAVYVCPCTSGCCTAVRSDKPGPCPQCGMELVPQQS